MHYISLHIVLQQVDKEAYEYRLTGMNSLADDLNKVIATLERLIGARDTDDITAVFLEGSISSVEKYESMTCLLNITELYADIAVDSRCTCVIQSDNESENWHEEFKSTFSRLITNQEAADCAKKLLTNWIDCLINDRLKQIRNEHVAEGSCTNFFEF